MIYEIILNVKPKTVRTWIYFSALKINNQLYSLLSTNQFTFIEVNLRSALLCDSHEHNQDLKAHRFTD